ncbi:MAG: hypothetical protein PWP23_3117 [Candidatus Sumerlaeota bacterium]|nr:hypothetical protein [Candidatus Sumerlaeota bacterium]
MAGEAPELLTQANLLAPQGLEGDRYALGTGHWSDYPDRSGIAVTLVATEAIDAVLRETGIDLRGGRHRRNLEVSGGDVRALTGRCFRLGEAVLEGIRPCAPCRYLDSLAGPGAREALARLGAGGLRAEVRVGGIIRVGDWIVEAGKHEN